MSESLQLQQQELLYLHDTDFLSAKLRIQHTLRLLLEQSQQQISQQKPALGLPSAVWEIPPKISRGENYEGLPYLVLDYPRIFQQETTFAYRCMFWWGHGFSCTLHLGGVYWEQVKSTVLVNLYQLEAQNWWVCVNDTPWEYHYRKDNYLSLQDCLSNKMQQQLAQKPFFKISSRLPLEQYQRLPHMCVQNLQQLAPLFKA